MMRIPFGKMAVESLSRIKGKGAMDIFFGNLLTKVAVFLGSLVVVRLMAKTDYGVLSYMENIYTYIALFAGYGLNNALFRFLVLKDTPEGKKGVFNYVIKQGTLFNICLVLVAGFCTFLFPHSEQFSAASLLLPVMLSGIVFQYLCDSCSFSLRSLFLNRQFALFSVLTVSVIWALRAIGCVVAGVQGAVWSWPVGFLIILITFGIYFHYKVFPNTDGTEPGKVERREIRKYSIQYMVTNSLWVIFLQNDILLLGMLLGDATSVADYKVAYTIPAAVAIISSSVGMFVAPYFIKHEDNHAWVWDTYKKVLGVCILSIGALCVIIGLFCEFVISLLYGDAYTNVVPLMNILLAAAFLNNALRYTTANLFAAMGKIRVNMTVAIIGIVLQIALDLLLIPLYGVYGAALTSFAVFFVMALAVMIPFATYYRKKAV